MRLQRRACLAALASFALRPAHAAGREELIAAGEQALSEGEAQAALVQFERAASFGHHADTELRTVRALMQAGAYRQALALCAHGVGEHGDEPGPAALYAWLLDAGGQQQVARQVLARAPDATLVAETRQALTAGPRVASPRMLDLPHRFAPVAVRSVMAPPDAGARVAGSAALLDSGSRALAPASLALGGDRLWVRNGLGMARGAVLERRLDGLGLALLRLEAPLPMPDAPAFAAHDPFAGSPGAVVGYTATATADPAWPCLRAGFLGRGATGASGLRRLGIALPASVDGAAVVDAAGRFCGVALHPAGGEAMWWPLSELRNALPDVLPAAAPSNAATTMALDQAYEHALWRSLQLIVAPA